MQNSGYVNMDVQVPALAFEYKDKPGVYIGVRGRNNRFEQCVVMD